MSAFQSLWGMIQTPSGGARSSSLPPIDSSLPQPSPLNHRLTNLDIPYADHQLLRWTTVRVSTSSGSFLVASPPGSTMSDLLAESNRLMLKNLREAQVITALRMPNGDMFDEECPVAALLGAGQGKIMEVLGLTEEEEKEWPVRLHEAFSGKKKVVPEKEHAGTDMILSVTSTGGRTRAVSNVGSVHNLEINAPASIPSAPTRKGVSVFVSYCWLNSKQAMGEEAKGLCDPRALHGFLRDKGFDDIWLDVERMASGGDLFEQIATGMMACNVVVACVSDEYAASKNCVRELNFAVNVLRLPYITLVVGEGQSWQRTKVGLMVGDQLYINAQNEPDLPEKLESLVTSLDKVISLLPQTVSAVDDDDTESIVDSQIDDTSSVLPDLSYQSEITGDSDKTLKLRRPQHRHHRLHGMWWKTKRFGLGEIKPGDRLECARWTKSSGVYFLQGLHWTPVQILEVKEAEGDEEAGDKRWRGMRRALVQFDARIVAANKVGKVKIVEKHTEWVDEIMLRKRNYTGLGTPNFAFGDEVEYRLFIELVRTPEPQTPDTVNDSNSEISDIADSDSYDFWPGRVEAILPSGQFYVRCGYGPWLSPESGYFTGSLKLCQPGAVRPGIDPRLRWLKELIEEKKLYIHGTGAILRPQHILPPDPPSTLDPPLDAFQDASRLWNKADPSPFFKPIPPCTVFVSHYLPDPCAENNEECTKKRTFEMRMIAQELRRNGLRVISAESRVRDADTKATEMKVGLDEAILEEVFKGMVKADVVLICLSPEYVRSPINQLELRNLRRLIDTPVVFAITSSLDSFDHSSDPNPHYPVMDLTTILKHTFSYDYPSSPVIIDLTIPPLFISRCVVLSRALGEAAASYDASCAAKEEEEKHANPPPWQISKVTEGMMNSFTLEGMCLVSTFVEEVLASEDGGKCARQRTAIAGYAWVPHHKEILNRQPTTRKDVCTVALVKETGTNWIASWGWVQGQEEVSNDRAEGISMGKINVWKAWRWIKTIREKVSRAPVMGENRTQINVGARVEVKVLWMEGQYPRFLWWPAVVEAKMDDTFTVSLNAIKMDGSEGIRMVADIRELRLSEDPRAWKWFSLRYIYFTAQTHNGNMAPYAAPTASINRACQSMEQNIKDRISPEGLVWTRAPKYTPRAAGEAVLSLIDRCRLVKRFDGDPKNDEVFTECIRIDNGEEEQGLLVEFGPEVKSARRVISAYPLLMADGKDGEESYVEIEIVSLGETDDGKAFVSIGLGLRPSPPFMMAGWMPNSVALHSFFGRRLREGRTDFPLRAQPFGAGDIVGIYFHRKGKIGFTLNGVSLDDEADSCIKQAYLVLSADGPCVMRVNAGQRPFICQGEAVFGEHSKTENRGDGGDGGEGKKANDAE